jgi:Acetyltransferase (GNAT) domain
VSVDVRACGSLEELRDALNVISHYFRSENELEDAEKFAQWIDVDRVHAAWEGNRIVGGTGAFSFRLSVPGGGEIPAAGPRLWACSRPTGVAAC